MTVDFEKIKNDFINADVDERRRWETALPRCRDAD